MKIIRVFFVFVVIIGFIQMTFATDAMSESPAAVHFEAVCDKGAAHVAAHLLRGTLNAHAVPQNALEEHEKSMMPARVPSFTPLWNQFILEVYNGHDYSNYISRDLSHLTGALELCNQLGSNSSDVYRCIKIFYNKIKATEIVQDDALILVMQRIPQLIQQHIIRVPTHAHDAIFMQNYIENSLLKRFTDQFDILMNAPHHFTSSLARDIVSLVFQERERVIIAHKQEVMCQRIKNYVLRFTDTALGKLVWNQHAGVDVWHSFITLSNVIGYLAQTGVIDHMDDLDDLLWTLVHRFTFFLELSGSVLPSDFFETALEQIDRGEVYFLQAPEQDAYITTKKDTLLRALLGARVRARAYYEKGIIPHQMM